MKLGVEHRTPLVHTSISLDRAHIKAAQKHGLNVSAVCRHALEAAIKAVETGRTQQVSFEP